MQQTGEVMPGFSKVFRSGKFTNLVIDLDAVSKHFRRETGILILSSYYDLQVLR